jgi:hypothetical protein
MVIQFPEDQRHKYYAMMAKVETAVLPVWPRRLAKLFDPNICCTHFADPPVFERLLNRIIEQSTHLAQNARYLGGRKVRDAETWDFPAARLLTLRALMFYCDVFQVNEAHVSDRWANVTRQGEYNAPHAHIGSEYAVVYYLDLGDQDPTAPASGAFELIDARIPFCCSRREGFPVRGIVPDLAPGLMIGFPAELLHHAHPYLGLRPRVSLAWNINPGPPPAEPEFDPTQAVASEHGAISEFCEQGTA